METNGTSTEKQPKKILIVCQMNYSGTKGTTNYLLFPTKLKL